MKKLILLLIPLFLTSLFSEWSKIGNKEFLNFNAKLVSYSVTEDEQVFTGIGFSGLIYHYDLKTGRELSAVKIPNFDYEKDNAIMSKDGKTYIVAKYANGTGLTKCNLYIFDLQHNLIDSYETNFSVDSWYRGTFRMLGADYISDSKLFIVNVFNSVSSNGPNVGSAGYGITYMLKKENGSWSEITGDKRPSSCLFFNKNKELFYFNSSFSSSWYMYGPNKYYVYKNNSSSFLYDFKTNKKNQFHSYDSTHSKYGYYFNSGFFNTENNIVLSTGSQFFKFDNQDFEIPQIFDKDKRDLSNDFYIVKSKNSEEFFSFSGNKINLYTNDFKLNSIHQITEFTKINSIYHLSNTDEMLIYDGNFKLLKISKDNLFKGIADFSLPKYTFMTEDNLNFTNHTYGENLEFIWDFGDSTYSNEFEPKKTYSKVGIYKVKLIAKRGDYQTEIIKTVKIVPKFTADFEYTITGNFPKYITYKNTSTGKIDSFTWHFDSDTDSLKNVNDTTRIYIIPGEFKIKLVAYANGISSTEEKIIRLDFDEVNVDTNIIKKEYLINSVGSEALKGFHEGNDRIMYLISSDSIKQIGLLNNISIQWSKNVNNKTFSLLRRDNGLFTFLDSNRIINCDLIGNEKDKFNIIELSRFYFMNSHKNTIQYLSSIYGSNFSMIYYLNESNAIIDSSSYYTGYSFPGEITKEIINDNKFYANDSIIDAYFTFYFEGTYDKKYYHSNVLILNQDFWFNYPIFTHKIERLKDSLLFTCHTDSILRIKISPIQRIDSLKKKYTDYYYGYNSFKHKDFKFSYFHFLNDSLIVFSGNKKGKPAFLIINKDLELIKEYVVEERIGSFNHISQATNNRLLFSGYCYKEFGKKQPYFALIEDAFFPLNDRIIDTIPQDTVTTKIDTIDIYCYPNPTSEKLNINVGLSKPAKYNLKIFNSLGLLEYELKNQNYNNTDMKIEINLEKFSNGMYFFELDINGITKTDKFIYFRGN